MFAVDEHPTTVYAIACGYNLPLIANAAAKASLKKPLLADTASSDDLDLMTPSQYDKLLRYHKNVAHAVHTVATSFKWMKSHKPIPTVFSFSGKCQCPKTQVDAERRWGSPVANWVLQYQKDMADALAVTPDFNTVSRRGIATMRATTTAIASGCAICRQELEKLPSFAEYIADEVEFTTSIVCCSPLLGSATLITTLMTCKTTIDSSSILIDSVSLRGEARIIHDCKADCIILLSHMTATSCYFPAFLF